MSKNKNLIEKKVSLPQNEWDNLSQKGFYIPNGRFSMLHVMRNINFTEFLNTMDQRSQQIMAILALNKVGLKVQGTLEGMYFEICDPAKTEHFQSFLVTKLSKEEKDCDQEIIDYHVKPMCDKDQAIFINK